MTTRPKGEAQPHEFEEVSRAAQPPTRHLDLGDLDDVTLDISADLGRAEMTVGEILELARGMIVPLDKVAGEMTDICVNGLPLARGEVMVIGDVLHVRIGEIHGSVEESEGEASGT